MFCLILYTRWLKNIKIETVSAKTELNIEGNINFLENSLFEIQHTYSSEPSTGQNNSETPVFDISLNIIQILPKR